MTAYSFNLKIFFELAQGVVCGRREVKDWILRNLDAIIITFRCYEMFLKDVLIFLGLTYIGIDFSMMPNIYNG